MTPINTKIKTPPVLIYGTIETTILTPKKLAAAFTEWERRYREDPDGFQKDHERLAETCETYGDSAAAYLVELIQAMP